MNDKFQVSRRFTISGKRNMTVIHIEKNIKITSPDYFENDKTDTQLKKEIWEVMKFAIKIFGDNNVNK